MHASWAGAQAVPAAGASTTREPVVVMTIDGAIGPATADHLHRALARAAAQHARLAVLQIDTPGGLDASMRSIIKDIHASPVPVASFVAPGGALAASAGTYILYASHIAAMAPASNLGAATPVAIGMPSPGGAPDAAARPHEPPNGASGDPMAAKRLSDAAAYIRSLAQLRGRNADWAEKAVRESVSLSASEALARNVIDLVARDVPDLLRQLDGRALELHGATLRLHTRDAPLIMIEADWRSRLLSVITNPSVALYLMMIGIFGLLFEFANPGFVLPGVAGAISLLLGLFALQMLPVNYAGLGLILLGVGFLVAEAFVPSFGTLGLGGIIAFAAGAVLLIDSDAPGFGIPWQAILMLTALSAAFILVVAGMAAKAGRRPLVGGAAALLGAGGELVEFSDGSGWALVHGVHWRVRGAPGLQPGDQVRVTGVAGTTLQVAAAATTPAGPAKGA
jgi:membrane-bound serine protease (ClpP class)